MIDLQNKSITIILIIFTQLGCATSYFKITKMDDMKTEVIVTPDRIALECEHVNADEPENGIIYGFSLHMLNDEKTVDTAIRSNAYNKDDCEKEISKISKIIKNSKNIYVAGMSNFNKPRVTVDFKTTFPKYGTFQNTNHTMQLFFVANDKGECYGIYTGDTKPCPRDEFPIDRLSP